MPGNVVLHARRLELRRVPAAFHCRRKRVPGLALEEHPSITQLAGKLLQGGPLVRRPRSRSCSMSAQCRARKVRLVLHDGPRRVSTSRPCFAYLGPPALPALDSLFDVVTCRCVLTVRVIYHQRLAHYSNDDVHAHLHATMHTCYTSNATTREEICFNTTRHITLNTTSSLPPINSATPAPRS